MTKMNNSEQFVAELRSQMADKGLSALEIAGHLGCGPLEIEHILAGKAVVDGGLPERLCEFVRNAIPKSRPHMQPGSETSASIVHRSLGYLRARASAGETWRVDVRAWIAQVQAWTANQASHLTLALAPGAVNELRTARAPHVAVISDQITRFEAAAAAERPQKTQATPAEWRTWAVAHDFALASEFERALNTVTQSDNAPGEGGDGAPTNSAAEGNKQWWHDSALPLARQLEREWKRKDMHIVPSGSRAGKVALSEISAEVARQLTKNGSGKKIASKSVNNYLKRQGWDD